MRLTGKPEGGAAPPGTVTVSPAPAPRPEAPAVLDADAMFGRIPMSDQEFAQFQNFIYETAGISLSESKKALVSGRLTKRVQLLGLKSFLAYFQYITSGSAPDELQMAIDLLTTNETYFFREPKHFDFVRSVILEDRRRPRPLRFWSAASSSGEEAYSLAMLLMDCMGPQGWEVLASDISTRVLERARSGLYVAERMEYMPPDYLKRFCLRGTGNYEGMLMIDKAIRERVQFGQVNLIGMHPDLGKFDVIFLRNVLIYFDNETKGKVVEKLAKALKPDGYLIISHSESLMGVSHSLNMYRPSIYRCAAP